VRLATPAADCSGVTPGLRGVEADPGEESSSRSSGGVRKGSSSGRCSTTGRDETDG